MKTGIVLEGGGMRGLFTVGFLDVLIENNIFVDCLVGVSAGVLFGCNYKSHQAGRGLRYNLKYKDDPRYMGWKSWLKTGNFLSVDFAYDEMPMKLDVFDIDAFNAEPMEFHIVCTDIVTGETVYKEMNKFTEDTLTWMRASGSMPLMATPVELDGHTMLDGGITDSIPLKHSQDLGVEKNIVLLTQPKGYKKKPFALPSIFKLFMRKYPKVYELMRDRYIMYNNEIDYVYSHENDENTMIIYPDEPLNIGRVENDGEKMKHCYALGRKKAEQMLEEIKKFVG